MQALTTILRPYFARPYLELCCCRYESGHEHIGSPACLGWIPRSIHTPVNRLVQERTASSPSFQAKGYMFMYMSPFSPSNRLTMFCINTLVNPTIHRDTYTPGLDLATEWGGALFLPYAHAARFSAPHVTKDTPKTTGTLIRLLHVYTGICTCRLHPTGRSLSQLMGQFPSCLPLLRHISPIPQIQFTTRPKAEEAGLPALLATTENYGSNNYTNTGSSLSPCHTATKKHRRIAKEHMFQ